MPSRDNQRVNRPDLIQAVAESLHAQKGQAEYLCEVPLPDGVNLAPLLNQLGIIYRSMVGWDPRLALARAAVEFCIEHEDSGGLVVPFMRRLGIEDEDACKRIWNDHIGPTVRDAIRRWAGFAPDFRWKNVGPVRVHAGIPRRLIPRFARLIFDLACENGLHALTSLPSATLKEAVTIAFQGTLFAREFLSSEAGEDLVRATGSVLVRSGWPARREGGDSLADEPGFHADFLPALLRELNLILDDEGRRPKPGISRGLWPLIVVIEDQGRIAIRFPGVATNKECRYTWDQGDANRINIRSVMYLGQSTRYEDIYRGTVTTGGSVGEWSIRAWPRQNSQWAFFELMGSLIVSHDAKANASLPAGEYLVAVSGELASRVRDDDKIKIRAELGWLDFDGARVGDFELLQIELAEGSKALPDMSVLPQESVPRFDVDMSHPLNDVASDVDVVIPVGAPYVEVKNWNAQRAAHFRIMLEEQGQTKDVTQQIRLMGDSHRLQLPGHPHIGVIRIEGRGRRSGSMKSESSLTYAVWPYVTITQSPEILAVNEKGMLSIKTSSTELEIIDDKGRLMSRIVEIVPPSNEVTFLLRIRGETLRVTPRIPRAGLFITGDARKPIILDISDIDSRDRALANGRLGDFTIVAAAGKGWKLNLRTSRDTYPLFEISAFEATRAMTGRYPLRWSQIIDAVRATNCEVGLFELAQGGRQLPLDAVLIDTSALHRPRVTLDTPEGLPDQVLDCLHSLHALQTGQRPPDGEVDSQVPALQTVHHAWLSCAQVVFGVKGPLKGPLKSLSEIIRASHERLKADTAADLLERWRKHDIDSMFAQAGVCRDIWPSSWHERLLAAEQRLTSAADSAGIMRQLRRAVLERTLAPADVPDGLFNGLRNYRLAFTSPSVSAFHSALHQFVAARQASVEPWGEVAHAFHLLSLLRAGHVTRFLALAVDQSTHRIPACLMWVANNLLGSAHGNLIKGVTWRLSDVSPLDDDAIIDGLLEPERPHAKEPQTWLTSWLHWRSCVSIAGEIEQQALALARKKKDQIFDTLEDRDRILNELESGRLVEWTT